MSGRPIIDNWPAHTSGTTFVGVGYQWTDEDGDPYDFTGSDAQFIARDANGDIVFDWQASDEEKPGVYFVDPDTGMVDPTKGTIYIVGPDVEELDADHGMLRWTLRVWHDANGEVFIDVAGSWQIMEGA
jgi:hypothetical protein